MSEFVREVRWGNIGLSLHWRSWLPRRLYVLTPWGNLILVPRGEPLLFSERYGKKQFIELGFVRITWVWLRGPAK